MNPRLSKWIAALSLFSLLIYFGASHFSFDNPISLEEKLFSEISKPMEVSDLQRKERNLFNQRTRDLDGVDKDKKISAEEVVSKFSKAIDERKAERAEKTHTDTDQVKADLASISTRTIDGELQGIYRDRIGRIVGISANIPLPPGQSQEEAITELIRDHSSLFGAGESLKVHHKATTADNGFQSFIVSRGYKDLPVWGKQIKVIGNDEAISGFNGFFQDIPEELDTSYKLTAQEIKTIIEKDKGRPLETFQTDTVKEGIYFTGNLPFHAYRVTASISFFETFEFYVSPSSRKVITSISLVSDAQVPSQGVDLKGASQSFYSEQTQSEYQMIDRTSLNGITSRNEINDFSNNLLSSSSSSSSGWDRAAVSALINVEKTAKYFKETHNRNSYDNNQGPIVSYVNFSTEKVTDCNAMYRNDLNLIYYTPESSSCHATSIDLEVAGHELSHGVVMHTAGLEYMNQSGALNESFADIFGTMVNRDGNWLLGEELFKDGSYLRNMKAPWVLSHRLGTSYGGNGNYPGHMDDYVHLPNTYDTDSGGVHINSSIPNRAYYLLAEGLTTENKGTSVGLAKAEQLAYKTLVVLGQKSDFLDAAISMIQVADSVYGKNSNETQAVKAAWSGVGVYNQIKEEVSKTEEPGINIIPLSMGDDMLFFLYPRDGTLEVGTLYSEGYDIYGTRASQPHVYNESTLIGPLNDVPASAITPSAMTFSDGATLLTYKGTNGQVYFTDLTNKIEDKPLEVNDEISRLTFSKDGRKVAFVLKGDNAIYVLDVASEAVKSYKVLGPSTSENRDDSSSDVDVVDAIDFDLTGGQIVFDYRSCVGSSSPKNQTVCIKSWNIGILDLSTGFEYPFNGLAKGLDLGNPRFSNIGRNEIVLDVVDWQNFDSTGEIISSVARVNFDEKSAETLFGTNFEDPSRLFYGAPAFLGEDEAVTAQVRSTSKDDSDFISIVSAKLDEQYAYDPNAIVFMLPYEAAFGAAHRLAYKNITARLIANPSALNFRNLEKGEKGSVQLKLKNTGNRKIEIFNVSYSKGLTGDLTATGIAPGAERVFFVYLDSNKVDINNFTGRISVSHDGDNPSLVIGVTGSGAVNNQTAGCANQTISTVYLDGKDYVSGGVISDTASGILDLCGVFNTEILEITGTADFFFKVDLGEGAGFEKTPLLTITGSGVSAPIFSGGSTNSRSAIFKVDLENRLAANQTYKVDIAGITVQSATDVQVSVSLHETLTDANKAKPDAIFFNTKTYIDFSIVDLDSDGDGIDDNIDAFPNDASETKDSDSDGVGDNTDAFPNDSSESKDRDKDGVGDSADAFPSDPKETKDSDKDGVGDRADAFPNNSKETKDSDGDGVGDNADGYPNDPTKSSYNICTDPSVSAKLASASTLPIEKRLVVANPASNKNQQTFVRFVNPFNETVQVELYGTDDGGIASKSMPIIFSLAAGESKQMNAQDLENGNATKGLESSICDGAGKWQITARSSKKIEIMGLIRTPDGFLTGLTDVVPVTPGTNFELPKNIVYFANPASNSKQQTFLRIVNNSSEDGTVTIAAIDNLGLTAPDTVRFDTKSNSSKQMTAKDLENGNFAKGLYGKLGDGAGKWRLIIESALDISAQSLIRTPDGFLTNLSAVVTPDTNGLSTLNFFNPASYTAQQSFMRLINSGTEDTYITISGVDDTGQIAPNGDVSLVLAAGHSVELSAADLEQGNADLKLRGSLGVGSGRWRLALSHSLESKISVMSYVLTSTGFLTNMSEVVGPASTTNTVWIFNPGSNSNQASKLRVINSGSSATSVTISGIDDTGSTGPGSNLTFNLAAGSVKEITAAELEDGSSEKGLAGGIGDGKGKWRLTVTSDEPVTVQSLLETPAGFITNLSTSAQ